MTEAWHDIFERDSLRDQIRDRLSIARGEKRARMIRRVGLVAHGLELQKLRALEDIDNIALTLGEVSP